MNRRGLLAVIAAAATAAGGCVADEGPTDDQSTGQSTDEAVVEQFDTGPDRPECEKESEIIEVEQAGETYEYETAATVPYPPEPESFDEATIASFVEEFDNAYVRHDVLCRGRSGEILNVSHSVEETVTLDWQDEISHFLIFRAAGASAGLDDSGAMWEAGIGYSGVVYAIDETGVARAEFEDAAMLEPDQREDQAPDPLENGYLVAEF